MGSLCSSDQLELASFLFIDVSMNNRNARILCVYNTYKNPDSSLSQGSLVKPYKGYIKGV